MTYLELAFAEPLGWEVTGAPEAMGYCHCRSCRSWSGGPVNAFSLWSRRPCRSRRGNEHVATFQKTEFSEAHNCREMRRAPDEHDLAPWASWTCTPRRYLYLVFISVFISITTRDGAAHAGRTA